MAYKRYDIFWRSEFYNIRSAKDRVQDLNLSQLKLKITDTYRKNGNKTTHFEPSDDADVVNKAYLDTKISEVNGQTSYIEQNIAFKLNGDKNQSEEEVLFEGAVKTTTKTLYDLGLFDGYDNADEVLKN